MPLGWNAMPSSVELRALGIAAINVSTPNVSHASRSSDCSERAIVDFPELDPPFRTITDIPTRHFASLVLPKAADRLARPLSPDSLVGLGQ